MTRIFDAFRKSQHGRPEPAPRPAPFDPPPATLGSAAPARAMAMPAGIVALPVAVRLPENLLREMSALRITVESLLGERATRSVMFCSSTAGEGTTTIASQFAHVLATDDRLRILLIDAHVRRPGLVQTLDRQMTAQTREAAGEARRGSLSVLGIGEEVRRAGLYTPAQLRAVLDAVGGTYDWVVIDAPPALEAPETAGLAGVTDGVVLVVHAGRTKKPVMSRAVDLLRKGGGRVLGSVLNHRRHEIPNFIYRRL